MYTACICRLIKPILETSTKLSYVTILPYNIPKCEVHAHIHKAFRSISANTYRYKISHTLLIKFNVNTSRRKQLRSWFASSLSNQTVPTAY